MQDPRCQLRCSCLVHSRLRTHPARLPSALSPLNGFERHYDESEEYWQALWGVFWTNNHTIKTGGLVTECRWLHHAPPAIVLRSSQRKFNVVGYADPSSQGIFTTEWPAKLQWQHFVIDLDRNVRARWANRVGHTGSYGNIHCAS
jgi:hypothetical protein